MDVQDLTRTELDRRVQSLNIHDRLARLLSGHYSADRLFLFYYYFFILRRTKTVITFYNLWSWRMIIWALKQVSFVEKSSFSNFFLLYVFSCLKWLSTSSTTWIKQRRIFTFFREVRLTRFSGNSIIFLFLSSVEFNWWFPKLL